MIYGSMPLTFSLRCIFLILIVSSECHGGVVDVLTGGLNKLKKALTDIQKSMNDFKEEILTVKQYKDQLTAALKDSCKHPPGLLRFLEVRHCVSSLKGLNTEQKCRQMFDTYTCVKRNVTSMCDPKENKHSISDMLGFFNAGISHLCKESAKQLDDFMNKKGTECLTKDKRKYFDCWKNSFKKVNVTKKEQRCKAVKNFQKCFKKEMTTCKPSAAVIADQIMTRALKQTTCKGCFLLPQLSSIVVALLFLIFQHHRNENYRL